MTAKHFPQKDVFGSRRSPLFRRISPYSLHPVEKFTAYNALVGIFNDYPIGFRHGFLHIGAGLKLALHHVTAINPILEHGINAVFALVCMAALNIPVGCKPF